MFKKIKNRKGFTLIELIVVIAILAVLAAIIIPTVANNIERANDARDVANARSAYAEFTVALLLAEDPDDVDKTVPIPGGSCVASLSIEEGEEGTVGSFVCTMTDEDTFSLQADGQIKKDE